MILPLKQSQKFSIKPLLMLQDAAEQSMKFQRAANAIMLKQPILAVHSLIADPKNNL